MRTSGPLVPSPGYGPPVSSGIAVSEADAVDAVVDAVVEAVVLDDVVEAVPAEDEAVDAVESLAAEVDADFESLPHAARTAAAPMPTIAPSAARRLKEG
ncbi:MAG TPA: hypothetical protein VFE86_15850, partial [Ilumatobacteraceae bacterium]|nr:hypothetical protein [Ilumatobacteraceae bacterium]